MATLWRDARGVGQVPQAGPPSFWRGDRDDVMDKQYQELLQTVLDDMNELNRNGMQNVMSAPGGGDRLERLMRLAEFILQLIERISRLTRPAEGATVRRSA